jgi:hypothetical protein
MTGEFCYVVRPADGAAYGPMTWAEFIRWARQNLEVWHVEGDPRVVALGDMSSLTDEQVEREMVRHGWLLRHRLLEYRYHARPGEDPGLAMARAQREIEERLDVGVGDLRVSDTAGDDRTVLVMHRDAEHPEGPAFLISFGD